MAMDSHDDNQYKILIDTVNNNRNEKCLSGSTSSEPNVRSDYRVIPFSSVLTPLCSTSGVTRDVENGDKNGHANSSRRKCGTLFKGITIEEFLENEYTCQLTAIDKLILKNKAALAEDQMKRGRPKTNELSSSAAQKKENRKGAKKAVLGSTIAAKKNATAKRVLTSSNCAGNESNKCNGAGKPSTSGKSKSKMANVIGDKQIKRAKSSNKNEEKQGEPNPRRKKILDGNCGLLLKMRTTLKKDSRNNSSNKKPLELKRLRTNLGYQTRSGNKERLRSGKTRLLPTEKTTEQGTRRPSKKLKPAEGNDLQTNESNGVVEKIPMKRVSDEPIDVEVDTTYEKRLKENEPVVSSVKASNDVPALINGLTPSSLVDGLKNVKIEKVIGMKRDFVESEKPQMVEVNVNMNIVGMMSTSHTMREYDNVKKKSFTMVEPPSSKPVVKRVDRVESETDRRTEIKQTDTKQNSVAKESMFNALGLQSIERVQQKKEKEPPIKERENYTGTLKAVIKTDKGCRRIEMKPKECDTTVGEFLRDNIVSFYSKTLQKELSKESVIEISGSSNDEDSVSMDPSNLEHDTDKMEYNVIHNNVPLLNSIKEAGTDTATDDDRVSESSKDKNKTVEQLVVPEKSSSFSIHPDRLCSDVCKYCFGKFGILDTPCHIAQLKNSERQNNILSTEPNLKMDTCLCDACFRFVDRRANRPPKRRKTMNGPSPSSQGTLCAVQNCNQLALRAGKRKWWVKMGKKIANLSFDITKRGPFGLCLDHYDLVEMHRMCGMCKKRLIRNEMYSVRTEVDRYNEILKEDGFPMIMLNNTFLCKYCHHGLSLRLTYGSPDRMSIVNREYYHSFRNEILPLSKYNAENSDSEISNSSVEQKFESENRISMPDNACIKDNVSNASLASSSSTSGKTDESKTAHDVGINEIANILKGSEKSSTRIELKFSNLNIGTLSNLNIGQNNTQSDCTPPSSIVGQSSTPPPPPSSSSTATVSTMETTDEKLRLNADFKFKNRQDESTNLERCQSVILFDSVTKKLWQDLQKPYGNQSSFLRHLILMEKYWRNGALKLAENADPAAVKYVNGMKSRVDSLGPSMSSKTISPATQPTISTTQPITLAVQSIPTLTMQSIPVKPKMPKTPPSTSTVQPITLTVQPITAKSTMPSLTPAPRSQQAPTNTRYLSCPPPLLKLNTTDKDSRRIFVDALKPSPPPAMPNQNTKITPQLAPVRKNQEISERVKVELEESIRKQRELFKMTRNGMEETKPVAVAISPPKRQNTAKSNASAIPSSVYERFICTNTVPGIKPFKGATYSQARTRQQPQQQLQRQQPQQHRQPQPITTIPKSCVPKLLQLNGYTTVMTPSSYSTTSQASQPQTIIVQTTPQMKFITSPSTNTRDMIINSSSSLIAKLPKALTVTQISQSQTSRADGRRSTGAPFMVGEEPSVSVFREIQK